MGHTVADVAREVLAAINYQGTNHALAAQWVNSRIQELATDARLFRRTAILDCPAAVTAGTIAVTNDSATVTGDATAAAAWPSDVEGWALRVTENVWYPVVSRASTVLTLEAPFSGTTDTDATYTLAKVVHKLDPACEHPEVFVLPRLELNLRRYSQNALYKHEPSRIWGTAWPQVWALAEQGDDELVRVELYPYCQRQESVVYTFYARTPKLEMADLIPPPFKPWAVKEAAIIDAYRFAKATALGEGKVDVAGHWGNEEQRQTTRWLGDIKKRALMADPTTADATLAMERLTAAPRGDITSAADHVWSGGRE